MRTALVLSPALVTLVACSEPEPMPEERERTELREGTWKLRLAGPVLEGACPTIDGAPAAEIVEELDGFVLPAHVATTGPFGVRIDLEGVVLRGERADGWLSAEGRVDESHPSEPPEDDDRDDEDWGEDTDGEASGDEDGGGEAPPPCEVVEEPVEDPEREDGILVVLDASVLDAEHIEGELDIHYSSGEASCVINAELVGLYVGEPAEPEPCGEELPAEWETGGPDVEECG